MTGIPEINWQPFLEHPEDTCFCRCGSQYRSYVKYVLEISGIVSKTPCPNCGSQINLQKVSSEPEQWSLN